MQVIGFPAQTSWSNPGVLAPSQTYFYAVQAVNVDGNASAISNVAAATTHASPDTGDPGAAILSPANGAVLSGSTVDSVGWGADVRPSGVSHIGILVDGVVVGQVQGTQGYIVFNSTTVANRPHTITAVAWDNAGNSGTSAPVSVTVQN